MIKPDIMLHTNTHALMVMWSHVPLLSGYVYLVFFETTVPDLLSIAMIDLSQLNIAFGLSLNSNLSIVSSKRSKCCFHTVTFPILDLPRSTLSSFLLVNLCPNSKFLYHLTPGPVSVLNQFGLALFWRRPNQKPLLLELITNGSLGPYNQYSLLRTVLPLLLNHFFCQLLKLHTCCFFNPSKYFLVYHTALCSFTG